jgi:D-serine deaminase-like pyridoxal phosphate-dependent protein
MSGLDALLAEPLGVCTKGLPDTLADVPLGRVGELGLSLWAGDLLLPALTLRGDRLHHNLGRMRRFCDERGVALAPHGKTTMAPQLFADQLAAGAWGMTAATVGQAQVMARFGVGRILIANEVLDRRAIRWLAEADPELELYCLVDSVAGVEALEAAGRPVEALVEIGIAGRRGGLRETAAALRVLEAAARARHVRAAGVECFEGVVGERPAVDAVLERVAEVAERGSELLGERVVLSAGGSIFFDAAAELARIPNAEVVLRSGCYVVHDDGLYEAASPLGRTRGASDPLEPALELWADVLSCPEPGRAIAGAGRRDAPYDAGLPTVLRAYRDGEPLALGEAAVTELNDQHAFVSADGLEPGDLLCLGISHPCGAFDRWRTLLEVDAGYTVTRAIRTFF